MIRTFLVLAAAILLSGCDNSPKKVVVIPEPVRVTQGSGYFDLAKGAVMESPIFCQIDSTMNPEAYKLTVGDDIIEVIGGGEAGIFYAMQTLEQISVGNKVPKVVIEDSPRFAWRGVMLDCSRHIWSKDEVKRFIDMLAFHKLNVFHWHLTDGIGWRIQIDSQPLLTERGAFRIAKDESVPFVDFELAPEGYQGKTYGGFYTKDDVREIVEYASSKYIQIIPEIEMPGHSQAALACYPQYACPNSKNADVYCAGNDGTFKFLESIIDEIAELFPSQYIHIGGDEVGKGQWDACPVCRSRMAREGLKDGHELQSYFVKRIEKHINSKGKRLIGWDEISEGGLAQTATVMSWTGWQGGIKAANAGHDVVMCPMDYVYLDHCQGYNPDEPQSWGGYNGLRRVYDFPVVPQGIEPDKVQHILGGQGNMWTETVQTPDHLEYMLLPRMAALSEALWSREKNWERFAQKMDVQFRRYQEQDWNFSESSLVPMVKSLKDGVIELYTEIGTYPIYYTLEEPSATEKWTEYKSAIKIEKPSTLRARSSRGNEQDKVLMLTLPNLQNKATGCKITYHNPYSAGYSGGGDSCLVDNRYAINRGDDHAWQGFEREDMFLTIDLGSVQQISKVDLRFFQHRSTTSVLLPSWLTVEVSVDNSAFDKVYDEAVEKDENWNAIIKNHPILFQPKSARYVRVRAKNAGVIPEGQPRSGGNAWVFTDEISVN